MSAPGYQIPSLRHSPPARSRHGFTLVELMLAVSLMVIVVGCAYACLTAGFSARSIVEPRSDILQNARVALGLLSADLRSACLLSSGADFIGVRRQTGDYRADSLDFATHNYSPARAMEGDYCEISYFIEKHPRTGVLTLWRRRNPCIGVDPLAGGSREEIASGVQGLELQYTDGFEWYDTWGDPDGRGKQATSSRYAGNLSGLPEAVRITLMMEPERNGNKKQPGEALPPPLIFKTVAKINLAESLSSSSSSTSGQQTGNTPAEGAPAIPGQPQQ